MSIDKKHMPNYAAFFVLLLFLSPLILLELDVLREGSSILSYYKKYFGFVLLFEILLLVFVVSKTVIQYDNIPRLHRAPAVLLSLVFSMSTIALILCWTGYFNGGLYVFEWLNS